MMENSTFEALHVVGNSTTNSPSVLPSDELFDLLSQWQFVLLCFCVAQCYYAAMCICSMAVGETYGNLFSPFTLLKNALVGLYQALRHGDQRVGVSLGNDDESSNMFF